MLKSFLEWIHSILFITIPVRVGVRNKENEIIFDGSKYRVCLNIFDDACEGDCKDCYYLHGHISWWCTNKEAIKHYGTSIPGGTGCQFWKDPIRR